MIAQIVSNFWRNTLQMLRYSLSSCSLSEHIFFELCNSDGVSGHVAKLLAFFMHNGIKAYNLENWVHSQPVHLFHQVEEAKI